MSYPIWGDCCIAAPSASEIGKVLTVGANGIVLSTLAGGGIGTNISGIPSPTGIQLTSSTGSPYTVPLATTVNSGLLSPSEKVLLTSLSTSGLSSTNSITGNGLVATPFKLVNDLATPGNNFYYGTDASGVKGYYVLPSGGGINSLLTGFASSTGTITATDSILTSIQKLTGNLAAITPATKEKLDYLTPTGTSAVPNLTAVPSDSTKVMFYVNGLLERGITSNASGVVTVNVGTLGYNVDSTDLITAHYFTA
jgi:hypothetical protein